MLQSQALDENPIVDRIYEAGFNVEKWENAITALSIVTRSDSGGILLMRESRPMQALATGAAREVAEAFIAEGGWRSCRTCPKDKSQARGFASSTWPDYFPPDVENNRSYVVERALGLRYQTRSYMPMQTGEFPVVVLFRRGEQGGYGNEAIRLLNVFGPHLARALQISARLGLERARTSVSTLERLGLPAAVLRGDGRVIATNSLMDAMDGGVLPTAFGGARLEDATADALLQEAVKAARSRSHRGVRSIPMPGSEQRAPCVVHVLPICGSAHDIFASADVLLALTTASASRLVPAPSVLMGLFDLTPAEVKVATALSAGKSLKEAAEGAGIRFKSARTYLDRIFVKTGVRQQSQLVALLKTSHSF